MVYTTVYQKMVTACSEQQQKMTEGKMGKVIGIDLGTTNSCVSVVENNTPVIIPAATGGRTTPSVVAFTRNGERLVGEPAKRQAITNPDRTISSVKRYMGSDWTIQIDSTVYKPQTISALILQQMKQEAEAFLGEPVTDAVITVPAYFNDIQRQATKDAGKIAGLNVLRIINEPTSAALSYGLDHGEPQKVMVYDLGGGTFDVSIIEISDGVIEVLSTSGNNHLGGDDFDDRITDWIVQNFKQEQQVDLRGDFSAIQRVREAAEQAKKELSASESAQIVLPYLTQKNGEPLHLDMTLTRRVFNELTADLIDETEKPVKRALSDAGVTPADLGLVLLVGGSTRIPAVQEKVRMLTGKEPSKNINPDECVAQGAAILGSNLSGGGLTSGETGHQLLLMDVTPLSLSIETVGGVATRLIERNSPIPTRFSRIFSTAAPFQTAVDIHVLQGERAMAKDNKTIGKFKLSGIRRAPAGVPQIEVTFDIDTNGILKVSAKDLGTGQEQSVVITSDERMSDQEIDEAIRESQMYASMDTVRRDAVAMRDGAAKAVADAQMKLKNEAKELNWGQKKQLKAAYKEVQKQLSKLKLDRVTEEEIDRIRQAKENLQQLL